MKLVIVESPYAGDLVRNLQYLELALHWCVMNNLSPYASHKMLTTCLDDDLPQERKLGLRAGYAWMRACDEVLFFTDFGWSRGMKAALDEVLKQNLPFRVIQMKDLPDAAADFHSFLSRLPGDTEPGPRKSRRDKSERDQPEGSVQPEDAALCGTASSPT